MNNPVFIEPNVAEVHSGGVVTLTIGDGVHLNALRFRDWQKIERVALALGANRSVTSVVVRGFGGVFCSGSDLHEWSQSSAPSIDASFVQMERAFEAIEAITVPTVAFVETVAAGAGCQLALACDLQILARSSRIGMPILRLGILTPPSFAARLTSRIGASRAKALLYDGRLLTADDAQQMGLVTHAVPDESALAELKALLHTWSTMPLPALRAAKASVRAASEPLARPHHPDRPTSFVGEEFDQRVAAFLAR